MVKKILMVLTMILFLSSCGFFGDTMFPTAVSENYEWFFSGEIRYFYILDNDVDDDLLIVVTEDMGTARVMIFDTSLNLRGFMDPHDYNNPINTDGVGFVDHNGDFVIGQTKISRLGTTNPEDVSFVNVPYDPDNFSMNSSKVFSYTDDATFTDYYLRLNYNGSIEIYNDAWGWVNGQFMPDNMSFVINQKEQNFSDVAFANQNGELYLFTKKQLFDHADNVTPIVPGTPTISIVNPELSQWVTRCSRGYFVSSYNGDYVLYGNDGAEIDRVESRDHYSDEVVTIDYDCEYYYVINRDDGRIVKERLPF